MIALWLPSCSSGGDFKISLFFIHLATKAESALFYGSIFGLFLEKSLVKFFFFFDEEFSNF
jgi:hypothetical protein